MTTGGGFTTMAGAKAEKEAPRLGIGMLGYAFMGKAHSNAYKKIPYMMYPPPAVPELTAICGRNEANVREAARRYGYHKYYTDWHDLLKDEEVQIFDNGAPNYLHGEPCIAAAEAGKHLVCEKPLGLSPEESKAMLDAAEKAGVKHLVGYNYRFVPAIRLARELIESGKLGRIYHFRGVYLQEWVLPHYNVGMTWRLDKDVAGCGALGDLGTHLIDLGRFLVGEIETVSAMTRIFVDERPRDDGTMAKVEIDDAFVSTVAFENGAIGTLEATRFAAGRKNHEVIEVNGEKGTIKFDLERLNELEVHWIDEEPKTTQGMKTVLVSEPYHPWWSNWWPQGHMIGWEHTFIHELTHLLDCIVNDKDVAPYGATFLDGYRADCVVAAILESAETKRQVDVVY
ncbi:MAG: Gfo/Idh/MocA family oxidoreductase [Anaerolineae bacterium]|nr:Gfo/Idh/MocA family oxidoreductase [Anaerolineae bacterium]